MGYLHCKQPGCHFLWTSGVVPLPLAVALLNIYTDPIPEPKTCNIPGGHCYSEAIYLMYPIKMIYSRLELLIVNPYLQQ